MNVRRWALVAALAIGGGLAAGCGDDPACEPGTVCVWAGHTGELGFNGDGLHRTDTRLYWPLDMNFAPDGTPYVLDWNNHSIRRVNADETFETVVGDLSPLDGAPDDSDLTAPGAPGEIVSLNHPTDMVFTADGAMVFAAWHNHKLRRYDPATGLVMVLAGRGVGYAGDGGGLDEARFNQPKAVAIDPDGSIYVLDQRNFRVRKVDGDGIESVVGTGAPGFSGDGGSPELAELRFETGPNPEPSGALAIGPDGALYIADSRNHCIRRVDFEANTIVTVAGNGTPGFSGDGGLALDAQINDPRDLEIGPDGRLYIADTENQRIRVVDLEAGTIDTFAGSGERGVAAEGLPPGEIQLHRPFGIAFDPAGDLYISDTFNSRILKVNR